MAKNWIEKEIDKRKRIIKQAQTITYASHMNTITELQSKYDFTFGTMEKTDVNKMTEDEQNKYVKSIKRITDYTDNFLRNRGFNISFN